MGSYPWGKGQRNSHGSKLGFFCLSQSSCSSHSLITNRSLRIISLTKVNIPYNNKLFSLSLNFLGNECRVTLTWEKEKHVNRKSQTHRRVRWWQRVVGQVSSDPVVNLSKGRVVSLYSKVLPGGLVIPISHSYNLSKLFWYMWAVTL